MISLGGRLFLRSQKKRKRIFKEIAESGNIWGDMADGTSKVTVLHRGSLPLMKLCWRFDHCATANMCVRPEIALQLQVSFF